MKPVIYFVHYSVAPGGIEVLLPEIISKLNDWQVKVFVIRPPEQGDLNVYKDVPVEIRYGSNSNLVALAKLFWLAVKNRNAIYHLFNAGPFFLFALRLASVKKIVYSIHGTIYWRSSFQMLFRKLFWSLANSKRIIFTSNSEYSGKVFNEKVLKQVVVRKIYNPIDLNRFNSNSHNSTSGNELKIIYVGRLTDGKNLFTWIEAAEFLLDNDIKAVFDIYGTGELYDDIEKRIKKSKHHEKIKLKGHVLKIEEVYKKSDLLLFLSEYESFGNVAVESILCGVPVITLNIPAMKEVFADFPVFLIDRNKNIEVQVIEKVQNIGKLRSAANDAAFLFKTKFASQQHIDQLREVYSVFK